MSSLKVIRCCELFIESIFFYEFPTIYNTLKSYVKCELKRRCPMHLGSKSINKWPNGSLVANLYADCTRFLLPNWRPRKSTLTTSRGFFSKSICVTFTSIVLEFGLFWYKLCLKNYGVFIFEPSRNDKIPKFFLLAGFCVYIVKNYQLTICFGTRTNLAPIESFDNIYYFSEFFFEFCFYFLPMLIHVKCFVKMRIK